MTEIEAKALLENKKEEAERITNNFLSYSGGEIRKANRTIEMCDMAIQALEEVQAYKAIGTIDEFKALKEKNEPKKIEKRGYVFVCPICKKWLQSSQENCHGCGQALDWQ